MAGNLVESLHPLVIPQESRNFRRNFGSKHLRNLHTPTDMGSCSSSDEPSVKPRSDNKHAYSVQGVQHAMPQGWKPPLVELTDLVAAALSENLIDVCYLPLHATLTALCKEVSPGYSHAVILSVLRLMLCYSHAVLASYLYYCVSLSRCLTLTLS